MNRMSRSVVGKAERLLHELRFALGAGKVPVEPFRLSDLARASPFFEEHGWVLIRDVFTEAEIDAFRADVLASEREGLTGDLLSNPRLSHALLDDRILRIATALLGAKPTYYGDSSWYSSNTSPFAIGFHKDNADKFNQQGPDWDGAYPLLRIGIYLQDHAEHSGGVALRDRSHHTTDCLVGQPFAVPSRKGDVVVWSFRTSHSGFVGRLRVFPSVFVPVTVQNALTVAKQGRYVRPGRLFRSMQYPERLVLFMSFGVDGRHLRRYIEYLKTRRFAIVLWQSSRYTDAMRAEIGRRGLGFIDAPAQVQGMDPSAASEEHHDPPPDMFVPEWTDAATG